MNDIYFAGIDIGSTTAKVAIFDKEKKMVFSRYRRHQGKITKTTQAILKEALGDLGDVNLDLSITGSAGMGMAETFGLPFVQEVVASAHYIEVFYPEIRTYIEIGGEDSKIIFFDDHLRPDIRMNGSCAGGTGAFIDQMAVLLDVDVSKLNAMAQRSSTIYPIASRCGVFAKTDVQALLSRHVSKEDIAASVFHAVALQIITTLSRGRDMERKVLLGGGPLTFNQNLQQAFSNLLCIEDPNDLVIPDHPEMLPAMGTAMIRSGEPYRSSISRLVSMSSNPVKRTKTDNTQGLEPLFKTRSEFDLWQKKHAQSRVPRVDLSDVRGKDLFLGIDSGSTTTKIVLTDEEGKVVLGHYGANNGDPIHAVKKGLYAFKEKMDAIGFSPCIVRSAATGYGEDLIRAAFGLDDGVVETMAHYQAALRFEPEVSFIMDIGGQDMKAIYIHDYAVSEIQVNEACSSGCGSFIETFAQSLGYSTQNFAKIACEGHEPFDLGTRCTVFMNSKVKQAFREGATIPDISAGLAYSVINNALYKVLKLRDTELLGDKILVQGGTFRNPAVLRALELLLDKEVIRPDISELMGAYGAALSALSNHHAGYERPNTLFTLENLEEKTSFSKKEIRCKGCENQCTVLKLGFGNQNYFYTGNRCERYFSNAPVSVHKGKNLIAEQTKLLFDRNMEPEGRPILTYGIPICLNMYENFPFWCAFLTQCGFRVVLSSRSNLKLYEKGAPTVMSENICFPAKLAHGHILDLVEKKVDRIFYPTVVYEQSENNNTMNSYNCPVVTGYPDLLKSAIDPGDKYGVPLDNPPISFKDTKLLKKQLYLFLKQFGIDRHTISMGVEKGLEAQIAYKKKIKDQSRALIDSAQGQSRPLIVLAGRPYHIDPLVNHGIPDLLANMGADVLSGDAVPVSIDQTALNDIRVLSQWEYTNRLYAIAKWVCQTDNNVQLVHLTSFGCGLDAIATDETREIIQNSSKLYTMIKMDEIANLGAVRLRLRSLLETMKERKDHPQTAPLNKRQTTRAFMAKDRNKTLIAPYFSPFYSPLIKAGFSALGYQVDILPPQDKATIEWGLKNINNDMCYPAILVAGDIIKAFNSGRYDPENTAVLLTQTGGQCRASSYVALVKKAITKAGLENIPMVTVSPEEINYQPGFEIDKKGLAKRMALGVIFADALAQMYLSIKVREKVAGKARGLHNKYLSQMETGVEQADFSYLLNLLSRAVEEFNQIECDDRPIPRIGIVGEIFVKYNPFSNGNIIEWFSKQGVEV
ncbi:MAG: acyl-CoA dehydratase activase-related protein, partial [Thermodesulfobacteriota bacterium]|nr:acyl-CoA dehydratase activase-related protein [Thermodesulfobacteriota bacterium]